MTSPSRTASIDGPVHYLDHGGDGVPIVMVHGLGGSVINWHLVAPALAKEHRVFALDLVGFGRTEPGRRSASVTANAAVVNRFVEDVVGEPAVLIGNSMGGLVVQLAAAGRPELCAGLVLVAPAVPAVSAASFSPTNIRRIGVPALPGIGPATLRRYWAGTPIDQQIEEAWKILASDPSRIDPEYMELATEMMERRATTEWAPGAFSEASRSLGATLTRRSKYRAIIHRIAAPTLLVQGDDDKVVIPEAAARLIHERPDWDVVFIKGVGHVPMIKTPDLFLDAVLPWLANLPPGAPLMG